MPPESARTASRGRVLSLATLPVSMSYHHGNLREALLARATTTSMVSPVGTIASMGMEYHVVHHLYPSIPLFQTGTAYWAMRELLVERGCRIDGL